MIRGVPYDAEVEYIQSTGTQWIDTGWIFQKNIRLVFDITYMGSGTFGRNAGTYECLWSGSSFFFGGGISFIARSNFVRYEMDYDFTAGNMVAKVNGSVFRQTTGTQPTDTKIVLFAMMTGNTRSPAPIRHGRFTIYKDGIAVLDMVPVRIGTEGAMYDRVSRKLFRNNGTGAFSYGPDVATPVMGLHFTRPYVAAHTARDYVQDGLVALFDAIENKDWGVQDAAATTWIDLTGHEAPLTFPRGGITWGEKSVRYYFAAENPAVQRSYPDGLTVEWISLSPLTVILDNSDTFIKYGYPNVNIVRAICGNTSVDISSSGIYSATSQTKNATLTSGPGGTKVYFKGAGRVVSSVRQIGATERSGMICLGRKVNGQVCYASSFRMYNRALTEDEVAHNPAIDVERFGIP